MGGLDSILRQLLTEVRASRVTMREDIPGEYRFPVTHEALAAGVGSLRDEHTVDLSNQPVVRELLAGRQVVQPDCAAAYDDPAFQAMLLTYGGLAAQIVTPIFAGDRVVAILSLHQLGSPRMWTESEIAACADAATHIGNLL